MPGRLAIDFGTSSTLAALWDTEQGEALPLILPEFSRTVAVAGAQGEFEEVPIIPSIIHYAEDGQKRIGQQVFQSDLYESASTFRWMKRYIARRSPMHLQVGASQITPAQAGHDFLAEILSAAAAGIGLNPQEEEIALTVPVESFEHYDQWLISVAESIGIPHVRLIDEATAAAIGYGAHVNPNDVYIIFDFGAGTLDVSVVMVEEEETPAGTGRRCRVISKAGSDLGGATIDEWIFRDVLKHSNASDADENARKISRKLLIDCERAKELLSVSDKADVSVLDIFTGYMLGAEYTRASFEQMLDRRGLYRKVEATVRRALEGARLQGFGEDQVKAVFMIGGSSLIPSVQQTLTRIFGGDRVMIDRPLEAVACGAAAFVAGVDVYDHIQHDYAIRFNDAEKGGFAYRPIIRAGTHYPTHEPVAKVLLKPSHAGQDRLGVSVFEMGPNGESGELGVELVFDQDGAARLQKATDDEKHRRSHFWLNEASPTFLPGDGQYEVQFGIDPQRRLVLSAKNVGSGEFVYRDVPLVTLS